MELLLSALAGLPEFSALASLLTAGETAALSGVGQLPRSHILAGLTRAVSRPALILCPDDQSAQKCQIELAAFLGAAPALLPSREFTFCEAAVVSRGWEQRRLHLLWKLGKGQIPILVSSLEALSLRTMPPAVLFSAATTLRPLCDTLIGINASPMVAEEYKLGLVSVALRSYHFMMKANILHDKEVCDLLVEPVDMGNYDTFDVDKGREIFDVGYTSTKALLTPALLKKVRLH